MTDASKPKKHASGSQNRKRKHQVSVRLNDHEMDLLNAMSVQLELSPAEIMRKLLRGEME